jgi:hypothetical protein
MVAGEERIKTKCIDPVSAYHLMVMLYTKIYITARGMIEKVARKYLPQPIIKEYYTKRRTLVFFLAPMKPLSPII